MEIACALSNKPLVYLTHGIQDLGAFESAYGKQLKIWVQTYIGRVDTVLSKST